MLLLRLRVLRLALGARDHLSLPRTSGLVVERRGLVRLLSSLDRPLPLPLYKGSDMEEVDDDGERLRFRRESESRFGFRRL